MATFGGAPGRLFRRLRRIAVAPRPPGRSLGPKLGKFLAGAAVAASASTGAVLLAGPAEGLLSQTITFTSTPPAPSIVGGPTYTVTATGGGSGNPVTFTIDSSATSVCSISGAVVSFTAVGTCVIDANQAGDSNYAPAPEVQQGFLVYLSQTITFTSTAPSDATVGGPTYTVTATGGGSGNPVTFTIDSSATSVCSISGSIVSFVAVGSCSVDANQAGNSTYAAATQAQQSFSVSQGSQAITFSTPAPNYAAVGGPTYTVGASGGGSGNPVTFTIDSSATSVCSISGSVVSFTATGTCTIDANQAGNTNYLAAPQAQQSFTVFEFPQTITFTSTPPSNESIGGPTYTVTATGGASGNPVVFDIDATATSECTISGAVVSFIGAGACVIDANQAGNSSYAAAPEAQQLVAVGQLPQAIVFTSKAPTNALPGDHYAVTALGGPSGNPVVFASSTPSVCTVSKVLVKIVAAGTCTIVANQAASTNYSAAPAVEQSFNVSPFSQTIAFVSNPPILATVGGHYKVVAKGGGSGMPVLLSSETLGVCSVSGRTVTIAGAGICTIDANQMGDAQYSAAPQAQQSFFIEERGQTITFTSVPPTKAKVGGPTYAVTATGGGSRNPIEFSIDSGSQSVCSIAGSIVSFIGPGTCTIDANQFGNQSYLNAPQAEQTVLVSQTPDITSTCPATASPGQPYECEITYTGSPTPTLTISKPPSWLSFQNNGNGTATLGGTPSKPGSVHLKMTAVNSAGRARQTLSITVQ